MGDENDNVNGNDVALVNYQTLNEDEGEIPEEMTVPEAIEAIGFGKFQIILMMLCGLNWSGDAMELMIMSLLPPSLTCTWGLKPEYNALLSTIVFSGMVIGAPIWGVVGDKYGRKASLITCTLVAAVFGLGSAFSNSYIMLVVFRGITGIGLAGLMQVCTYSFEFIPTQKRGRTIMYLSVFFSAGAVLEVLLGLLFANTVSLDMAWRLLLGFSSLPLWISLISYHFLPDGPMYLYSQGDSAGAEKIIRRVAAINKKEFPCKRIRDQTEEEASHVFSPLELFSTRELTQQTILLSVIWLCMAFSYYGISLMTTDFVQRGNVCDMADFLSEAEANNTLNWRNLGSKSSQMHPNGTEIREPCTPMTTRNYLDELWTTASELPFLILTILGVDYLGRKPTLGGLGVVFGGCMALLLICSPHWIIIILLFLGRGSISASFQALTLYTPEVYPTHIRAFGVAITSAFGRLGTVSTPYVGQYLVEFHPMLCLGIYTTCGALIGICSFLLPVESRGKTLQ